MKKSKSQETAAENDSPNKAEQNKAEQDDFLIVGIGASAGGVQALKTFFENVPADSNAAYVVILHLSPDHDSQLTEILRTVAAIPVERVVEKVKVEANRVYVVSPNESLSMADGHIVVSPIHTVEERRAPVDIFFRTLAESHLGRAVAVVLSGTGANGSMGIKRVKERGGAAFVQNPREAEFSEMPRNSIATELIDQILNVAEIPAKIVAYGKNRGKFIIPIAPEEREEAQQSALREIFTMLRVRMGHDFSNYKRPTVLRRIERRINVRSLPDLPAYAVYLKENPDETQALLKDLLISVTNFFRDKEAFDYLEKEIIPKITAGKKSSDQIRVWVAGCATGEEAYSLAMLFAEQTAHSLDAPSVQIFATDIDEAAIASAREGFYTLNDAADVSPERLRRFFTAEKDGFRVGRELRGMILFANHNLLKDPAFSRLDLATCRNLLIYFNGAAQERVLETLHFALKPGGFLFLGTSESIDGAGDLYMPVSRELRVFQARQTQPRFSYPVPDLSPSLRFDQSPTVIKTPKNEKNSFEKISYGDLHGRILEQFAPPSMIVNELFDIVHVSPNAGRFLQIAGEVTNNLFDLIKTELRLDVGTAVYQAVQNQTNVVAKNLKVNFGGDHTETLNVSVRPVLRDNGDTASDFILIVFEPAEDAPDEIETVLTSPEPVNRRLEEALLQSQSQYRYSIEQSEVQAEELKASNEELQAINEELRSATEELETGKEELQSVNEELVTVNQELKIKIEEVSNSNNDLQNLINSTNIGTVFLDRNAHVKLFTPVAREIFNLIPADVGRLLYDITHKLEDENLIADVESVLSKLQPVKREVGTSDDNFYLMQITPYRTAEDRIGGTIITFVNITERKKAEENQRESARNLEWQTRIFDTTLSSITDFAYTLDKDGRFTFSNKPLLDLLGITLEEIIGKNFFDLNYPPDLAARLQSQIQKVFDTKKTVSDEKSFTSETTGACGFYEYILNPVLASNGDVELVAGSTRDITKRKRSEAHLAFLADFSRELIHLTTERTIVESFGEKFNRLTDASVCAFFEIGETGEICVSNNEWRRANAHSMLGKYDMREFVTSEFQQMMSAGKAVVMRDVAADAQVRDKEKFDRLEIGSFVHIPLIRGGEWRFALGVYHEQPYDWRDDEIALLVEATGRIWTKLERIRAGQALRESEERLQLIIKSVEDYAIITTDTEGAINGWNPGAAKMFGYSEKEIVGENCEILYAPEDRAAGIPARQMQTAIELGSVEDERVHVRKDGSRFFFSGVIQLLKNGKLDGFVKIARDLTERHAAEQTMRDKEMLQKLVGAQEDERKRIARDLHDELGQLLTGLRLKLEAVRRSCEDNADLCGKVDDTQRLAKQIDAGIDFLAWELRPAALDDLGLRAALEKYVREWSHYAGVTAELLGDANVRKMRLAPEAETNLYRIAQEALNNVHKHAGARRVEVILDRRDGDSVVLIIEDDGAGFDPQEKMNREKGIGLIGIRERAALIGGSFEIESAPGAGTTVFVRVPGSVILEREAVNDE